MQQQELGWLHVVHLGSLWCVTICACTCIFVVYFNSLFYFYFCEFSFTSASISLPVFYINLLRWHISNEFACIALCCGTIHFSCSMPAQIHICLCNTTPFSASPPLGLARCLSDVLISLTKFVFMVFTNMQSYVFAFTIYLYSLTTANYSLRLQIDTYACMYLFVWVVSAYVRVCAAV